MSIDALMQLIGTYAFPIVVCAYLLYDKQRSDTAHKEEVDSLRQSMVESNNRMIEAINNNTLALQRLGGSQDESI